MLKNAVFFHSAEAAAKTENRLVNAYSAQVSFRGLPEFVKQGTFTILKTRSEI